MDERDAFLRALQKDEDDAISRLIYADWLEERGEDEEAERQRRWPAAKRWLVQLARDASYEDEPPVQYQDLVETGRRAREGSGYFPCYDNQRLADLLREKPKEFWKNWSIFTGTPVSDDWVQTEFYPGCAC